MFNNFVFYFLPFSFKKYEIDTWSQRDTYLSLRLSQLRASENNFFNLNTLNKKGLILRYKIEKKLLHRFVIWSVSAKKISKNTFLGYGLGSSRKFGENETIEFIDSSTGKEKKIIYPAIPLHPHNNSIQIWLELGLVGIIIFYSFSILFGTKYYLDIILVKMFVHLFQEV